MSDETEGQIPESTDPTAPPPDPVEIDALPVDDALGVLVMEDDRCTCRIRSTLSQLERQALADELRRNIMRL